MASEPYPVGEHEVHQSKEGNQASPPLRHARYHNPQNDPEYKPKVQSLPTLSCIVPSSAKRATEFTFSDFTSRSVAFTFTVTDWLWCLLAGFPL